MGSQRKTGIIHWFAPLLVWGIKVKGYVGLRVLELPDLYHLGLGGWVKEAVGRIQGSGTVRIQGLGLELQGFRGWGFGAVNITISGWGLWE